MGRSGLWVERVLFERRDEKRCIPLYPAAFMLGSSVRFDLMPDESKHSKAGDREGDYLSMMLDQSPITGARESPV